MAQTMISVRALRQAKGYSQKELAEQAGISVRTLQRVEADPKALKGHTLRVLAEALGVASEDLSDFTFTDDHIQGKITLINLSCLSCLVLPFGNVVLPLILWLRNKSHPQVNEAGRRILNFQILWTLAMGLSFFLFPYVQVLVPEIPLVIPFLLVFLLANFWVIFRTAAAIRRQDYTFLDLPLRIL